MADKGAFTLSPLFSGWTGTSVTFRNANNITWLPPAPIQLGSASLFTQVPTAPVAGQLWPRNPQ